MPDWNLALIDVVCAWVVVALPRYTQARLLARSRLYATEAIQALGIDERLSIDPIKHTSLPGTLLMPALCSLADIPVIAWGKPLETGRVPEAVPRLAVRLWMAPVIVYLAQSAVLGILMAVLAKVYLAGAPVAARAGQLCMLLAALNFMALPLLDSGLAHAFLASRRWVHGWKAAILTLALLTALSRLGWLRALDAHVDMAFFFLSRWLV